MKEFTKSLNTAFFERLKNPLLGSFFLAFLSVNHKGIIAYYYAKPEVKVQIVNKFSFWDWKDLVLAGALVLLYIALTQFILPLIQHFIDKRKLEWVDKPRFIQRGESEKADYDAQALVSKSKLQSETEYVQKVLNDELEDWKKNKNILKSSIVNLEKKLEEQNTQIVDHEETINIELSKVTLLTLQARILDSIVKGYIYDKSNIDDNKTSQINYEKDKHGALVINDIKITSDFDKRKIHDVLSNLTYEELIALSESTLSIAPFAKSIVNANSDDNYSLRA